MFSFASFCRLLGIFALSVFASAPVLAQCPSGDPKRGLLANDVFRAQPMKAVYLGSRRKCWQLSTHFRFDSNP